MEEKGFSFKTLIRHFIKISEDGKISDESNVLSANTNGVSGKITCSDDSVR